MVLLQYAKNYKKAYYVVSLKDSPAHIKYMYSATINQGVVKSVDLDCVTNINGELVSFKKIFSIKTKNISLHKKTIKDHANLFIKLLQNKHKDVVFK